VPNQCGYVLNTGHHRSVVVDSATSFESMCRLPRWFSGTFAEDAQFLCRYLYSERVVMDWIFAVVVGVAFWQ
jgi:hypothetical protein